uniref:Uncharacterized protein n=1 Tax=Anguilla anguilla TaxID=7936 RepID=A0A0E9SQB9_ANGAN
MSSTSEVVMLGLFGKVKANYSFQYLTWGVSGEFVSMVMSCARTN